MREIKFRAWDKQGKGKFVNVRYANLHDGTLYTPDDDSPDLDMIVLMQCTGLKDKNGVEIYDSDLLKARDDTAEESPMLVVWIDELASFGLRKKGWMHTHYFQEAVNPSECEVIGNIYENPELLKETQ